MSIPGRDFNKIIGTARVHYENLKVDIDNASNRVEHIRLSALAQEAHNLLTDLLTFELGLVYSHTNNIDAQLEARMAAATINEPSTDEILDLPEFAAPPFVSPFNPNL
jgi:hypothetical protein